MLQIGITGGIACGKSTILEQISSLGYSVFSSDAAFKAIFDTAEVQEWLKEQITQRKGEDGWKEYQEVGKTMIRYLVLSDPQFKTDYESFVHPMIRKAMIEANADVSEVPLLFETSGESCFRHIWVVACDPETQISRLMERMSCNRDYALAWINKQMSLRDKIERATRVIYTDETPDKVFEIVKQSLAEDLTMVG
jgi:dephospho-CoA kinase